MNNSYRNHSQFLFKHEEINCSGKILKTLGQQTKSFKPFKPFKLGMKDDHRMTNSAPIGAPTINY
ncbi:MAG: hypothetical protein B7Y07_11695 [Halothiobacillus sp. 24-54-40]|nr:MAG: hypothetical protein B7X12_08350 [Halothiobacillus sp. 20-53-49]OYY32359.1 MAG: hypothetical protein B7Y58_10140 [Halothiobacillus sp. 35-54-62]OYZ85289.1 MAG: hypothetical protein B7Y07_11695 [Halothiobacillus sp. 24-54-40]